MELTKKDVSLILSKWNLKLLSYKKFEWGLVNDNWLVITNRGKFVLRRFVKKKSKSNLLFEYRFLKYLENRKFPYMVPTLIPMQNKMLFTKFNGGNFYIYKYIDGSRKEDSAATVKDAYLIGQMVASYCNLVESMNLDNGVRKTGGDEINAVFDELRKKVKIARKKKSEYDSIFIDVESKYENLLRRLSLGSYYKMRKYPLHYDMTLANVLWKNGRIAGVIDFENISHEKGALIMELVATLYCCRSKNGSRIDLKLYNALLEGYKSRRTISKAELGLLPDLLIINLASDLDFIYEKFLEGDKRMKLSWIKQGRSTAEWIYKNRKRMIGLSSQ